MTKTTIERFAALFEGRSDAFGSEEGGCLRPYETHLELCDAHLRGITPIGVYPLAPDIDEDSDLVGWLCRWGAVDFDIKSEHHKTYDYETPEDAFNAALDLKAALHLMGLTGWIERTRGGGYHVWVFAETWVPAADMRKALLAACQVAMVSTREVNPKSVGSDDPSFLGNYVRTCYAGWLNEKKRDYFRRVMVDHEGCYISLETFLDQAEQSLAEPRKLAAAAKLYHEPVAERSVEVGALPELDKAITDRLSGKTFVMFRDGPLEGPTDRSAWLWRLACNVRDDGLEPEACAAILLAADEQWTQKYAARRDAERQIERIVAKVYAQ